MLNKAQDAVVRLVDTLVGVTLPPIRLELCHTLQAVQKLALDGGTTLEGVQGTAEAAETTLEVVGAAAAEAKQILADINAGRVVEGAITTPEGKTYRVQVNLQRKEDG